MRDQMIVGTPVICDGDIEVTFQSEAGTGRTKVKCRYGDPRL